MSAHEILAEIRSLSPHERREIIREIFDMDDGAQLLRECDERAVENFRMLDALEDEDAKMRAR